MAITLETLLLDFQADFSKLDRQLNNASRRAESFANRLERQIGSIPLTFQVTDQATQELQGLSQEIAISVDSDTFSQAVRNLREVERLRGERLKNQNRTLILERRQELSEARAQKGTPKARETKEFTRAIKAGFSAAKKSEGFSLNPFAFIKGTLDSIFVGFRERIGGNFADGLSQGYVASFEDAIGKSLEDVGKDSVVVMGSFVEGVKQTVLDNAGMTEAQLHRKFRRISKTISTFILPKDKIIGQAQTVAGELGSILGGIVDQSLIRDAEGARMALGQLAVELQNLAEIPRQGFKDFKQERIQVAAKIAQRQSRNIETDSSLTNNVLMLSGGFAGEKGKSSDNLLKAVAPLLTNEDIALVPVDNISTDVSKSITESQPTWVFDGFKRALEFNLTRGYNPDSVDAASRAIAIKRDNPDANIAMMGHSAGGAVAQEMNTILNSIGERVETIGIGTPDNLFTSLDPTSHENLLTDEDGVKAFADVLRRIGFVGNETFNQNLPAQQASHYKAEYLSNPEARPQLDRVLSSVGTGLKDATFFDVLSENLAEVFSNYLYAVDDRLDQAEEEDFTPEQKREQANYLRSGLGDVAEGILELTKYAEDADISKLVKLVEQLSQVQDDIDELDSTDAINRLKELDQVFLAISAKEGLAPGSFPTLNVTDSGETAFNPTTGEIDMSGETLETLRDDPDSDEANRQMELLTREVRKLIVASTGLKVSIDEFALADEGIPKEEIKNLMKQAKANTADIRNNPDIPLIQRMDAEDLEFDALVFEQNHMDDLIQEIYDSQEGFEDYIGEMMDNLQMTEDAFERGKQAVGKNRINRNLLGANRKALRLEKLSELREGGQSLMQTRLGETGKNAEFTAKGLTKLADMLEISREDQGSTKADKALAISQKDTQLVIQAINKLGNTIRTKAFINSNRPSFATEDKRPAFTNLEGELDAVQINRESLSDAIDTSQGYAEDDERRQEALEAINNLLALQHRHLSKIKSNYKLTSDEIKQVNAAILSVSNTTRKLSSEVEEIGGDFAEGFEIGIESGMSNEAAKELGHESIKALKKAIDSHSPSRKTIQEGRNYSKGYAIGIVKESKQAYKAIRRLGFDSITELQKELDKGDFKLKGIEGLDKVNPISRANIIEDEKEDGFLAIDSSVLKNFDKLQKVLTDLEKDADELEVTMEMMFASILPTKAVEGFEVLSDRLNALSDNPGLPFIARQLSEIAGKNLGFLAQSVELLENLGVDSKSFNQLANSIGNVANNLGKAKNPLEVFTSILGAVNVNNFKDLFTTVAGGIINFAILRKVSGAIKNIVGNLFNFQKQAALVGNQVTAINHGLRSDLFERFGDAANKANSDVLDFASSYSSMAASLQGKVLNPEALFGNLAKGLAARGVLGDAQNRAFNALSQMASKGTVSMEELRQQLSEALPGSFAIAARAMGVTEARMISMVSNGEVLASDFLPKLAKELGTTSEVTETLIGNQTRLINTLNKIKYDAGKVMPFKEALGFLNGVLSKLSIFTIPLTIGMMALLAASITSVIVPMVKLAATSLIVKSTLIGLGVLTLKFAAIIAALAVVGAVLNEVLDTSNSHIRKISEEMSNLSKQGVKNLTKDLDNLEKHGVFKRLQEGFKLRGINKFHDSVDDAMQSLFELTNSLSLEITVENVARVEKQIEHLTKRASEITDKLALKDTLLLSTTEVRQLQQELEDINFEIDAVLKANFSPESLKKALDNVSILRKQIESRIETATDRVRFQAILSELDIREAKLLGLNELYKSLENKVSEAVKRGLESRVLENSYEGRLTDFKTQRSLTSLEENTGVDRGRIYDEIAARKENNDLIKKQIKLTNELINARRAEFNSFDATRQEFVLNLAGISSLEELNPESLSRLQEEVASRPDLDKTTERLVKVLESLVTNGQKLSQAHLDQAKAVRDSELLLRDLEIAFPKQELDGDQIEFDQKRFQDRVNDLQPGSNLNLSNLGSELKTQERDLGRQLIDLTRAFVDAVRAIKDSSRQLDINTRQLGLELKRTLSEVSRQILSGFTGFAQGAGIEDFFGINKIVNIADQATSLKASDRRPEIANKKEDAEFTYNRQLEDNLRRLQDVNRQVDDAIFNLKQAQQRSSVEYGLNLRNQSREVEELMLSYRQLEMTVRNHNREVQKYNLQMQDLGGSERLGMVDMNVDLSQLQNNPEVIVQQMEAIYKQMELSRDDAIRSMQSVQAKGNRDIQEANQRLAQSHSRNLAALSKESEQEAQRLAVASKNISKQLEGVSFGFTENLRRKLAQLTIQAREGKQTVNGLFAGLKEPTNPASDAMDRVSLQIARQIESFRVNKVQLEKILELTENEASLDNLKILVSQGMEGGTLSEDIGNKLNEMLVKAKTSDEFKEVLDEIQYATEQAEKAMEGLKKAEPRLVLRAKEIAERPFKRKMEDIQSEIEVESSRVSHKEYKQSNKDKLKEKVKEQKASSKVDIARTREDLEGTMHPDHIDRVAEAMQKLNEIQLSNLRKEMSLTYQVVDTVLGSLEESLTEAFEGIGETIGKSLTGEVKLIPGLLDVAKEAFKGFVGSVLSELTKMAAKQAVVATIKMFAGGFSGGGTVGNHSSGGTVGNYSTGGTIIGGGTSMNYGGAIGQAMAKEGKNARVIVAHKGEEILSTRNGDAQFLRALKKSGQWQDMKSSSNIPNYSQGGTVGAGSYAHSLRQSSQSRPTVTNINSNVTYNLSGNEDMLKRTTNQIEADRFRRMEAVKKRNK